MKKIIEDLKKCENEYLSYYSSYEDYEKYGVFIDNVVKNMYTHNYTYIKSGLSTFDAYDLVCKLIDENKNKSFINFLFAPDYELDLSLFSSKNLDISKLVYMIADIDSLKIKDTNNECIVKIADTPDLLYDGFICDIVGDDESYEFLYKCNTRKKNIFLNNKDKFRYFVAYVNSIPIGKCEIFICDRKIRIESLFVMEKYRNKYIASSIFASIVKYAKDNNILNIYLLAHEDDTPKNMYEKMGFNIVGYETWMLYEK